MGSAHRSCSVVGITPSGVADADQGGRASFSPNGAAHP
ncbi:MAG: hypothetical protein AVDCRST_MAG64-2188 [uncultured Phycisphaerae bacterium]|uniref:Uncharacterized protein n=1 Tax=uncultured Phycisphaerae bacterium TaxID=904963 RepID=A0A6J4P8J9_9BACT|nr:MAG: hypothetical protein AVDCRST_MAG64-2188 [uncultured Phycisphaerae bacterium]